MDQEEGGGSKAEYSRCKIPRLVIEEQDEEKLNKEEEQELTAKMAVLEERELEWGSRKG